LEDGAHLEVGDIYECYDEKNNVSGYFRASRNGSLFSMWKVTRDGKRCGGYQLPHYMNFVRKIED